MEVWWEQRGVGPALKTPHMHVVDNRWVRNSGAEVMTDQIPHIWNLFKFHQIPISCWFPVHNYQESGPLSYLPLNGTILPLPNAKVRSNRLNLVKKRWPTWKGFGYYGPRPRSSVGSSIPTLPDLCSVSTQFPSRNSAKGYHIFHP